MKCAKCTGELIEENILKMKIQRCLQCEGLFLDKNSFSKLIRDRNKNSIIENHADDEVVGNNFRGICPQCNVPLIRVKRLNGEIILDICNDCEGLWFDKGEFTTFDEKTDQSYNPVYIAKFLMKKLGAAIREKENSAKQKKIKALEKVKKDLEYLNAEGVFSSEKTNAMLDRIDETQANTILSAKKKKLIQKLESIYQSGLITEVQFESNKNKILSQK